MNIAHIERDAQRGADRLVSLITPSGAFLYAYSYSDGRSVGRKYNLVRHAGALWSILRVKKRLSSHDIAQIHKNFAWLFKHLVETSIGCQHLIDKKHIKLGADSLLLLALVEYFRYIDGMPHWKTIGENLYRGIVDMISGEDFAHKVPLSPLNLSPQGFQVDFRSKYYTGEALFATLAWRAFLQREPLTWEGTFGALFRARLDAEEGVDCCSHWMAYAVALYVRMFSNNDTIQKYVNKLFQALATDTIVSRRRESTPMSTHIEALMALQPLLTPAQRQQAMQIAEVYIRTQRDADWVKPDGAVIRGDAAETVRIDFIQHLITGWDAFATSHVP